MSNVKIFASIVDDATKKQVETLAASEAYRDAVIRVMPDCHAGKGCTIGSVIGYADRVVPNTVGVDIGCGMLVVELGKVDVDLRALDAVIKRHIPSGFNVHKTPISKFDAPFYAEIPESKREYIQCSIGTLGGGNHFIEVDADEDGNKYLVIHSGSRNLGVLVCESWQNKAILNLTDDSEQRANLIRTLKEQGREHDIQRELNAMDRPNINEDLAYLEGEDLFKYIQDMKNCQSYASLNRLNMATAICLEMSWKPMSSFETVHNYIDTRNRIIRKGAVSAEKGEMLIIPMNMRDGSLICVGKGNPDWLSSAPHGAGRIMSRAQAFKNLSMVDFMLSMDKVYSTTVNEDTLDEAPMAYKPIDIIMNDIRDTVDIVKVIKPLYNFKAAEKKKF